MDNTENEQELKNKIKNYFEKGGIPLNSRQVEQFYNYYLLLIEWNEKFNLTAITDFDDVLVKHFYDSAVCYNFFSQNASIIDVGCGAGFPSIPLKILRPDVKLTLIDSVNKKITFIDQLATTLQLVDVVAIHSRAEDLAFNAKYRQKYDYAVSRAVANLATLCEYCIPFVRVGGEFFAYKSQSAEEEIKLAKNAFSLLGGKLETVKDFSVEEYCRKLAVIRKEKETPQKYPRGNNKPRTSPL